MSRVLVVDDEEAMCAMLATRLRVRGFAVETRTNARSAIDALGAEDFDALVTDLNLEQASGIELCRNASSVRPDIPVIVITAFGSMQSAIDAIRAGAYDFIPKPFEIDQLVLAIERGVTHARLQLEVKRLRRAVQAERPRSIVGKSSRMNELFETVAKVAASDAAVLVTGETGTGKDLVARAVHAASARANGPFVAFNCAALPEHLVESELFGHVRGAFTDAHTPKTGLFVAAHGGTLFLDEIGELSLSLQPKLLRALQERRVRPLGSNSEVPFSARIVTATNRDLPTMIEEGRFREDLYFRLDVLQLEVPPLRARGGDVLLLAQHFLQRYAERDGKAVRGLSAEAAERLMAYPWPGNVRELQNCIERAVAMTAFDTISAADLPERIRTHRARSVVVGDGDLSSLVTLAEQEHWYVTRVLEEVGGNRSAAARILGIERKTLKRILDRGSRRQGDRSE